MSRKEFLIRFGIILLIFLVGVFVRVESFHPNDISPEGQFYQDQNGLPYMYELDSYYNYRLTADYLDHGYLGDKLVGGHPFDLHSYYPPGRSADYPPLLIYVTALFYKFVNVFSHTPLLIVCFWLPAFIAPLAGIVVYFMVRRFTNDYGAAAAGFLMVLIPYYFLRTIPGWFDTDMFNITLPLLAVFLINESLLVKNIKKSLLIMSLSGFIMFLFSMAWQGWQFYFYFLVIFSILYGIGCKIQGNEVRNFFAKIFAFIFVTILLVTIFNGFSYITGLFQGSLDFLKMSPITTSTGNWPNVLITISELEPPSLNKIILALGFSLFGGILGFLWIFRILIDKKLKEIYLGKMNWFFFFLLVSWTLIGFWLLKDGSRFIMIIIPPLVISSGIMVGLLIEYLNLFNNTKFPSLRRRKYIKIVGFIILALIVSSAVANVYTGISKIPAVNDDIWNASEWINNNTAPNTVVISSWSYGHFLTAISNRAVSFDGGSQNSPREYWIDRAFFTDNETLSLGIFRMLSSSGDLAYQTLEEYTGNTSKTVDILNSILGVDKNTAKSILLNNYHFNSGQADKVLNYTHPNNSNPFVLLTYDEMINDAFWVFYFGGWNFNTSQPGNYTYNYGTIHENNGYINTSNGVIKDLKTGKTIVKGKEPFLVMTAQNGQVEKKYLNISSHIMVIILMDQNEAVVMDKSFENSLFTNLVLLKRKTKYFIPLYENKQAVIWKSNSFY